MVWSWVNESFIVYTDGTSIRCHSCVKKKKTYCQLYMHINLAVLTDSGKNNGNRRGAQKKKSHELDNGLVPLPAKLCFQCNKWDISELALLIHMKHFNFRIEIQSCYFSPAFLC